MKAKLIVEGKEFDIEIQDPELQKLVAPPKKTGYERVKYGEKFYRYDFDGNICSDEDLNGICSQRHYDIANYYSDLTIAENNARADKLMRQLRRFMVEHREKELDWKSSKHAKWVIYYNYEDNILKTFPHYVEKYPFALFFDSKESAELAMATFRDELTWYFIEYKDSL